MINGTGKTLQVTQSTNYDRATIEGEYAKVGNTLAAIIENDSLPVVVRNNLSDAMCNILSEMALPYEVDAAWLKLYFAKACLREFAVEEAGDILNS